MDILPFVNLVHLSLSDCVDEYLSLFSITQLNLVFDQSSLFHYYFEEPNVIEQLTRKYLT